MQYMGEDTIILVGGYVGVLVVMLVAVGGFDCWLASSLVGD